MLTRVGNLNIRCICIFRAIKNEFKSARNFSIGVDVTIAAQSYWGHNQLLVYMFFFYCEVIISDLFIF